MARSTLRSEFASEAPSVETKAMAGHQEAVEGLEATLAGDALTAGAGAFWTGSGAGSGSGIGQAGSGAGSATVAASCSIWAARSRAIRKVAAPMMLKLKV